MSPNAENKKVLKVRRKSQRNGGLTSKKAFFFSNHLFTDGFRLFQWEAGGWMLQSEPYFLLLAHSLSVSCPQQDSLGWCKTPLHGGGKRGRGEKRSKREGGWQEKITFCGFLGVCQSPRIPHATHKVSIKKKKIQSSIKKLSSYWKEPFFWQLEDGAAITEGSICGGVPVTCFISKS